MLLSKKNSRWPGAKWLLGCLLFVFTPRCEAQNLVPNPSFELRDTCSYTPGFVGSAKPLYWDKYAQSPEYFNTCAPAVGLDTLLAVPLNGFGYQQALDGDSYVGMFAFGNATYYREYVGCALVEPLEVGETYDLSFYTNVAFGGNYWVTTWACNNMGMLFTMEPNVWSENVQPAFGVRNHAHLFAPEVISDTANWTLVSGSFVADSAYQYLVLGNFFSDELTDTVGIIPGPALGAYYFVDGVCVTKQGQECSFVSGIATPESSVSGIWPNPVADVLNVDMETATTWQVFDATGRLVQMGNSAPGGFNINVYNWAIGEYVLRLNGEARRHLRFLVLR
jgi:hypothetical protein